MKTGIMLVAAMSIGLGVSYSEEGRLTGFRGMSLGPVFGAAAGPAAGGGNGNGGPSLSAGPGLGGAVVTLPGPNGGAGGGSGAAPGRGTDSDSISAIDGNTYGDIACLSIQNNRIEHARCMKGFISADALPPWVNLADFISSRKAKYYSENFNSLYFSRGVSDLYSDAAKSPTGRTCQREYYLDAQRGGTLILGGLLLQDGMSVSVNGQSCLDLTFLNTGTHALYGGSDVNWPADLIPWKDRPMQFFACRVGGGNPGEDVTIQVARKDGITVNATVNALPSVGAGYYQWTRTSPVRYVEKAVGDNCFEDPLVRDNGPDQGYNLFYPYSIALDRTKMTLNVSGPVKTTRMSGNDFYGNSQAVMNAFCAGRKLGNPWEGTDLYPQVEIPIAVEKGARTLIVHENAVIASGDMIRFFADMRHLADDAAGTSDAEGLTLRAVDVTTSGFLTHRIRYSGGNMLGFQPSTLRIDGKPVGPWGIYGLLVVNPDGAWKYVPNVYQVDPPGGGITTCPQ